MATKLDRAVREICLWLPEAEEFLSHGSPNFRVRGKTFATYVVNHHGDGRVALWLNAPPGSQALHTDAQPTHFFIPPYVGPRGWLGANLDRGIDWSQLVTLVREAYEMVAPEMLRQRIGRTPALKAPSKLLAASEIDPYQNPRAQKMLKKIRALCLSYPEASEGRRFGYPVWLAGKRTFALCRYELTRLTLCFFVGIGQQGLLTADPRYQIPAYIGHHGWIALNVEEGADWDEIANLCMHSYRHFALKRMLQKLVR
jgi:predicted DNA-binding protein (MmcQ/YjbR family)